MDKNFRELYSSNPNKYCNAKFILNRYPEVYDAIIRLSPVFKIGLYMFIHDIKEVPKCTCGNPVKFKSAREGFCEYCSAKCAAMSKKTKQAREQTCMEKYGCKNISKVTRKKAQATMLERYGVVAALQNDQIREKQKTTMLERYGVDNATKSEKLMAKSIKTAMEHYGGIGMGSDVIKEKIISTNMAKYGYPIPSQSGCVKQKTSKTCMERYGVPTTGNIPYVRSKAKQTMKTRYGVESIFADKQRMDEIQKRKNDKFISSHNDLIGYTDSGEWICKCPHKDCTQCQERQYITTCMMYNDRKRCGAELCTKLLPKQSYYSAVELTIRDWLDELNISYDTNRRDLIAPKELDIYLPDFNIAIEINGCYWHSIDEKPKRYHIDKYNRCIRAGIKIITIWEDWIRDYPDQCRNLIMFHCGLDELKELPWDTNLVDLGLKDGPIKEHKSEHDGYECWDSGIYI